MTPDVLRALMSAEGQALLAAMPPYDAATVMDVTTSLRKQGVAPEVASALLTQARLRAKAHAKLGPFADGMLFTPDGIEQATRLIVATLHARRYLAAGVTCLADITCGIGGDAMVFAGVGLGVQAIDCDEVTAAIAAFNLRHFMGGDQPLAHVHHGDGLAFDFAAAGVDGIYADPARRAGGKRIFDPSAYAPPLDAVWDLTSRIPAVGIKVGPGIPHRGLPASAETQWVSVDGDVVEAGLWFGPLAPDGPGRSALVISHDNDARTLSRVIRQPRPDNGNPDGTAPDGGTAATPSDSTTGRDTAASQAPVGPLSDYIYEPDGAVIRAGLVAQAAHELDGHLIDPTIAYISCDAPANPPTPGQAPIATGYRVQDVMPFGVKRLKTYLRDRGVGRVTIKKRGTAVTPESLRPQLALRGSNEATIILTRIAGTQSVIVVEPFSD